MQSSPSPSIFPQHDSLMQTISDCSSTTKKHRETHSVQKTPHNLETHCVTTEAGEGAGVVVVVGTHPEEGVAAAPA